MMIKTLLLFAILLLIPTHAEPVENIFPVQVDTDKSLHIKKAMEFISSNRPAEAIQILSGYKPSTGELSFYHYAYAKANELSDKQHDSIEHFRLAYIYSQQGEMKELILLERAEAYLKMGCYSEAVMSFRVFLKIFPDSLYVPRAYLGLGDSLYKLGFFNEAIVSYEKAGNSSQALYRKANALQSMGRIKEAYNIYMPMIGRDSGYLKSSEDTLYNIGENLRQVGKFSDAKGYLNSIKTPSFKHRADMSLGLIVMEEAKFDVAIKYFNLALQSSDRQLRRRALLYLASAYAKSGRQNLAQSKLLEIRNEYPYGKDYDAAILMLSQLYRKGGKVDQAISLLKELVLRRSPDRSALDEFEAIILETKDRDAEGFLKLWGAVGYWLLEPSRSQSLLKIAKGLRHSGKPFLDVCIWLSKYGSDDAKAQSRLSLAEFYADIGDAASAVRYLLGIESLRHWIKGNNDDVLRIKAKIHLVDTKYQKAAESILSIKDVKQEDIVLLSDLLGLTNNTRKALYFYEKALNRLGGPSRLYIRLADTLYNMGKKSDALKYYRTLISIQPTAPGIADDDIKWALYRISMLSQGKESVDALKRIQKGNDILSRFSSVRLKESDLSERMGRVF